MSHAVAGMVAAKRWKSKSRMLTDKHERESNNVSDLRVEHHQGKDSCIFSITIFEFVPNFVHTSCPPFSKILWLIIRFLFFLDQKNQYRKQIHFIEPGKSPTIDSGRQWACLLLSLVIYTWLNGAILRGRTPCL